MVRQGFDGLLYNWPSGHDSLCKLLQVSSPNLLPLSVNEIKNDRPRDYGTLLLGSTFNKRRFLNLGIAKIGLTPPHPPILAHC